jgi:excisionase family DNA binding protein
MLNKNVKRQGLQNLKTHQEAYVTIGELAKYWLISRKQIYKQIEAGTLPAIRLGPRLLRIRTIDALDFEIRANMQSSPEQRQRAAEPAKESVKLRTQRRS